MKTSRAHLQQGKLIVFEGNDGSGKQTQVALLSHRLKKMGFCPLILDFPDYHSVFGILIGRMLTGEFIDSTKMDPFSISILHSLDRLFYRDTINNALAQGRIVIANRYTTANEIFQSVKFKKKKQQLEYISWLRKIEYHFIGLPKPDIVLYLFVPVNVIMKWVKQKEKRTYINKGEADLHERNALYQRKVQKQALWMVSCEQTWKKINCAKKNGIYTRTEIAQKVWNIIQPLIAS